MWKWIVGAVVLFLIWGKLSKKVLPASCISALSPTIPLTAGSSSGDSFNTGNTPVAGVCEPPIPPRLLITRQQPVTCVGTIPCCHVIAHFPVDPPPIAIQKAPPPPQISCQMVRRGVFTSGASGVPVRGGVYSMEPCGLGGSMSEDQCLPIGARRLSFL